MSWLRNSPLRASFGKLRPSSYPPKDSDPSACYDSFRKHWQQAMEIIVRTKPPVGYPIQDDVWGVVNHLKHMVTFLVWEHNKQQSHFPCLEHLLSENLLDTLFMWSMHTGRYRYDLRLEQLKMFETLVSNSQHHLLEHESFHRPLLKLLALCSEDWFPMEEEKKLDVEKKLVDLLNHLCISLMHNTELLGLFFHSPAHQGPDRFIIFTLLIPFVHREGAIGHQARDALLKCISLSAMNEYVGAYIADHSDICLVLVTGLSALYSELPRKLDVELEDWHRLTPDDVNDIPKLAMIMNSLVFCNAVVQVAHSKVKTQLMEFLHQGFLVPVMGPALLQVLSSPSHTPLVVVEQSTVEELVTSTAYLDLFVRTVTEPGLLYSFVKFILEEKYDGEKILDCLINRINSKTRLCLGTLALFETLVDLNCEDVMLELIFKHLVPCTHVMLSQRKRICDLDPYCRSSDKFLSLSPSCCTLPSSTLPASLSFTDHSPRPSESLYGNYHAYLCDSRRRIQACSVGCSKWAHPYNGEDPPHATTISKQSVNTSKSESSLSSKHVQQNSKLFNHVEIMEHKKEREVGLRSDTTMSAEVINDNGVAEKDSEEMTNVATNYHSLSSIDGSSGYDSFAFKGSSESTPDNEPNEDRPSEVDLGVSLDIEKEASVSKESDKNETKEGIEENLRRTSRNDDFWALRKFSQENSYVDIFNTTPDIGPFLDVVLGKLTSMLSNGLYINLHLTGLVSRLAVYPQPLLHSFLLNHSLVFQPSIRSLFQVSLNLHNTCFVQVLGSLKYRIDQYLSRHDNTEELLASAREFLLLREDRLVNARKNALEASSPPSRRNSLSTTEPFSRGEPKRRSFSSALSSMFRRTVQPQAIQENSLESIAHGVGYRYLINKPVWPTDLSDVYNVVMCAVLLDEWLKELAAITQERAVFA
uniref:FHF complex subunit HOOK-interacting protein C-terminal domain-containing protein n=1 Tax=Timema monikensis TaxID=170555 RepID=A0A7R9EAQ8_9NEOP|nr:unnamed protein product [Timema monikensis]